MYLIGVRLRGDVPGCFRAVASPYGRSFGKRNLSLEMYHLWGAPLAVWVDNGVRCPLGYLVKRPHVVTRYQSWPGRRSGGGDFWDALIRPTSFVDVCGSLGCGGGRLASLGAFLPNKASLQIHF